MDIQQKEYICYVPPPFRDMTTRIYSGSPNCALAIKVKCLQCAGFNREKIRDCRLSLCALHSFRPYQDFGDDQECPPVAE